MKNRGLVRYRSKDKKNPRKRYRMQYEKALKARRSQVQDYRGQPQKYKGEQSGLKTTTIKSTAL